MYACICRSHNIIISIYIVSGFVRIQVENVQSRCEGGLKPGQVIVSVAAEEKATMIVMGTRGMGVIRRTILGSVSDYVIHHSSCPVIICRFQEQNSDRLT